MRRLTMRCQTARARLRPLRKRKRGQTLVEYGLIIAMISIVAILVLQSLGTTTTNLYDYVDDQIDEANSYNPN